MKTLEEIQKHLDETVNTLLGQHRGRVDVVKVERDNSTVPHFVVVKMSGGCQGCAGAKATLKTIITNTVKDFDPTINFVVDNTDHTDKTNAFFKE
jgi:Fe-S cluster biogenesis protein NfuA